MDSGLPEALNRQRETVREWSQEREFAMLSKKIVAAIQSIAWNDLQSMLAEEVDTTWMEGDISLDQREYLLRALGKKPR